MADGAAQAVEPGLAGLARRLGQQPGLAQGLSTLERKASALTPPSASSFDSKALRRDALPEGRRPHGRLEGVPHHAADLARVALAVPADPGVDHARARRQGLHPHPLPELEEEPLPGLGEEGPGREPVAGRAGRGAGGGRPRGGRAPPKRRPS